VGTANKGIIVEPLPAVSASANYTAICSGHSIILTGSGLATYTWTASPGGETYTGSSVTVNPTVNTTYTVTGVGGNGCSPATGTIIVVHVIEEPYLICRCAGYLNVNCDETHVVYALEGDYGYFNWNWEENGVIQSGDYDDPEIQTQQVWPANILYQAVLTPKAGTGCGTITLTKDYAPAKSSTDVCSEYYEPRHSGNNGDTSNSNSSDTTSSINNLNNINGTSGLNIYPNPSDGTFTIEMNIGDNTSETALFNVYDVYGQLVDADNIILNKGYAKQVIKLNADLASGMYFVSVKSGGREYHRSITITHN